MLALEGQLLSALATIISSAQADIACTSGIRALKSVMSLMMLCIWGNDECSLNHINWRIVTNAPWHAGILTFSVVLGACVCAFVSAATSVDAG